MPAFMPTTFEFNQLSTDRIGHLFEFVYTQMTGVDLQIDTRDPGNPEPWCF